MRVKRLPTILALHLKRFKYMEQMNRFIKVSHRVVFPLELRLFNTVCMLVGASIITMKDYISITSFYSTVDFQ